MILYLVTSQMYENDLINLIRYLYFPSEQRLLAIKTKVKKVILYTYTRGGLISPDILFGGHPEAVIWKHGLDPYFSDLLLMNTTDILDATDRILSRYVH